MVAPLKTLTVPKLEVYGLAGTSAFEGKFYCWSDSAVGFLKIRDEQSRFNIFVANRVAAIQKLSESGEWRYLL